MPQQDFFQSNLFIAIVTFVVGLVGLYLYYRRKRDEKRRIAKIVMLEIENAQTELKEAKKLILSNPDEPLPEHLYVMPSDTWSKNKHLFIENFKPTEWNALNQFYAQCQLFDEAIGHNDARFGEHEKEIRKNVHRANYEFAVEYGEKIRLASTDDEKERLRKEFKERRDAVIEMVVSPYVYIYTPLKQNEIIHTCLNNVDTDLSLNAVGQKLEKLSKTRFLFWYY